MEILISFFSSALRCYCVLKVPNLLRNAFRVIMLSVKDTAHGQSWDERQMVLGGPSSEVEGRTGPE